MIPVTPAGTDPRLVWVQHHCNLTRDEAYGPGITMGVYPCNPTERPIPSMPAGPPALPGWSDLTADHPAPGFFEIVPAEPAPGSS